MPADATRLLIADSHVGWRTAISRKFAKLGFSVICAADGVTAVEILTESNIDVVLIEKQLPEWSGLAVCEHVRSLPEQWNMPIFLVDDEVCHSKFQATPVIGGPVGGNYFMSRTRNLEQMVEAIRRALAESPWSAHSQLLDTVLL